MATLKDKINRILGNNVRLLLPSYWWKRVFGLVVDRIDEVENNARITVDSKLSKTSKNAVQNKVIAEEFEVIAEKFDKQQCVFVVSSDGTAPENYKQQNKESYNKVYESIDADRWINVFVLYGGYFRIQVDSITFSGNNEVVLYATFNDSFIEFRVSFDGSVVTQYSGSLKIDSSVSSTSTNAVQNKVIKAYIDEKVANVGGSEIRELYVGDSLTEEQKAWNLETKQLVEQNKCITVHVLTEPIDILPAGTIIPQSLYKDGLFFYMATAGINQAIVNIGIDSNGNGLIAKEVRVPDSELSDTSTNVVQNKAVKAYIDNAIINTLNTEI